MTKVVRTLYYDEKARGFVLILWDGVIAAHHLLPRTILARAEAEALAAERFPEEVAA